MKASTRKTRKRYMSDEDFAELQASFNEAISYAKGGPNNCRVTKIAVPRAPKPRSRANIVALRRRLNYSQVMFARALNVSPKTVQAWEQGLRVPNDAALKLLAIAEKHPEVLFDSV
jgi:putative transcriptional regulator